MSDQTAYCVKCKKTVTVTDGVEQKNAKGRRMIKGKHAECGTVVCKILPSIKE